MPTLVRHGPGYGRRRLVHQVRTLTHWLDLATVARLIKQSDWSAIEGQGAGVASDSSGALARGYRRPVPLGVGMRSHARLLVLFMLSYALALVGLVGTPLPPAAAAGLALDASTPAVVKQKGTRLTTASFTPPAGSVLVISAQSNGNSDVKTIAVSDNLNTHLTYTELQAKGNTTNDVYAKLFWAPVTVSRTMTVTATIGGSNRDYGMLSVLVFTGANTASPIGASGGGRGATGVIADSYTSTASGSWGWLSYGDWAQRGVPKVPSSETVHASYNVSREDTFALIKRNATTAAAGTQVTMSTTSPTSGAQITHIYFEVVPANAQSGSGPTISSLVASPASIPSGNTSTLSWSVMGSPVPTLTIDNGVGDVSGLTSMVVKPTQTTTYTLTATNNQGTASATATVTVTAPDTTPPSAPTGLSATAVSSSQINLSWTAASDDVGVAGYRIFRGGAQVGSSTTTTYSDTGLAPNTSYSYAVRAYDAAGNLSDPSQSATATTPAATSSGPEPSGWYAGDPHVHRSCGGSPEAVSSILKKMDDEDLRFISLLADCGNGEVQNPTTDLPLVNGQDASISTASRIVHWDTEWHWDATYTQYAHQALGGHLVNLGVSSASHIWQEYTYPVINWAHQLGGISGFAHLQYLPSGIPNSLDCCTPIEYPVEVALGSADFISEDVSNTGDTAIEAYYKLLNDGFRPGFAAGTDYPCGNSVIGSRLTYSNLGGGAVTYGNWINAIKYGRTVVSRNGHNEFLNLVVNGSAGPGDQVPLATGGSLPVTVTWTSKASYTGTLQLVQNGKVVASKQATVTAGSPVTLTANVDFTKSGWVAARRMNATGTDHQVHTAAAFVLVNNAPIRASADDAQFYVDWIDTLLTKTSPGGEWNHFFPTDLAAAQARYQQAKAVFQQIKAEAAGPAAPAVSSFAASPATIIQGQSATLSWEVSGNPAPTVTIDNGVGDVSDRRSITVSPTQTTTYALTAQNTLGTATATATVTVSASQGLPQSIFTTQTPATSTTDGVDYELGTRFTSSSPGKITAIRFYKSASESGTHTGRIWSASGQQLASVVFSGESASGWQQQVLASPLGIEANTEYMVTVNTGGGYYVTTDGGLNSQVSSGDLKTVLGSNGRYGSIGAYPTNSWENSNYFRDVVFTR